MKELYRAVVKKKLIIACLDPDESQDGGVCRYNIEKYITDKALADLGLMAKYEEWAGEDGFTSSVAEPPRAEQVIQALFEFPPVEWSRLPQFQDVTIRLVVQRALAQYLRENQDLILQGEAASQKVKFNKFRRIFVSDHNLGAWKLGVDIKSMDQLKNTGMLSFETQHEACDAMLLLLNKLTWDASTPEALERKKRLVQDLKYAMFAGMRIILAHEDISLVGDEHFDRHACVFNDFFGDYKTPVFLKGGEANIYKTISVALKGKEWREAGLVSLAQVIRDTPNTKKELSKSLVKLLEGNDGHTIEIEHPQLLEKPAGVWSNPGPGPSKQSIRSDQSGPCRFQRVPSITPLRALRGTETSESLVEI